MSDNSPGKFETSTTIERSEGEEGTASESSVESSSSPSSGHRSASQSTPELYGERSGPSTGAPLDCYPASLPESSKLLNEKERKMASRQFESKVALSTFNCMLIVSYIAFLNASAIGQRKCFASSIPHNSGVLLALLAIQLHAGAIVLSCQQTSLCNDPNIDCPNGDLQNSLAVCNVIQFTGSMVFVLAIMESSCLFFEDYPYFIVFFVISFAGLVAFLYANGDLSKFYSDLVRLLEAKKAHSTQDSKV